MRSLSEKPLRGRLRFVGWFNAGLFVLVAFLMFFVFLNSQENLDVGLLAFLGAYAIAHIVGGLGCALEKPWGPLVLWPVCIIDLLAFPVGTLTGGYTLFILYETSDLIGVAQRSLYLTSVIPALLLALAVVAQLARDSDSEETAPLRSAIAAQGGTREFQRWINTLPKDPAQMATAIAHVQAQGLLRLDTTAQFDQVRLTAEGLARISIHDCASMGRGAATWEQQRAFMAGFDSSSMARLLEIKAGAILSELRDSTPIRTASDRDIGDYALFVYQSLTPADQRRYQTLANSIASASDTDVCWITRLYQSRATEQNPSRSRWVRVVLGQVAKEHR